MDAAIYARLSKNRHGISDNVQIQQAECEAYAEDLLWTVIQTESDDDIGASKFSGKPRPGYDRMLEAVRAGRIEVILCTEMPRLYRRMEELLELIKLAETTRLRRIETTDGMAYDLSTPEGIHGAIGAVNNAMLESGRLSKRIRRKKDAQARQGRPGGGRRPYGYEPDGVTLRPSEVAILVEAKNRYLAGETIREIVRDFFHRGTVSPYGKPWQIENFQRVLFSKRYLGIRVHKGAEYPALWPAIFTADEWARMDSRRQAIAARNPGPAPGVGRSYLLTGLVFCGRCGTRMAGSRRKVNGGYQRRYKCRRVDHYGQILGCGRVYRGADPLEAWITEAVLYRLSSPEVFAALSQTDENGLDDLVNEYQAAKARLDQMTTDYASGFLSREEYAVAKSVAETNLQAARDALGKAQNRQIHALPNADIIREVWEHSSLDWRQSVIRLLIDRIVIHPRSPGSHEWRGWRFQPEAVEVRWIV